MRREGDQALEIVGTWVRVGACMRGPALPCPTCRVTHPPAPAQAPSWAFVDLHTLEPTWAAEPFVGQMNSTLEQLEEGDQAAGRAGLGHIEVNAQGHQVPRAFCTHRFRAWAPPLSSHFTCRTPRQPDPSWGSWSASCTMRHSMPCPGPSSRY